MSEKISIKELLRLAKEEGIKPEVVLKTKVPAFRSFDISKDVDLIEEILRIYGYTNVPIERPNLPMNVEVNKPFEERIRNLLTDRGFNEVVTFPWIEESLKEIFNLPSYWEIINPLSAEQKYMRTSLVPSLVKVQKFNQNNFNYDVAIFELGKRYFENGEIPTLGILAVGKFERHFTGQSNWDFLTFKGVVESVLTRFGISKYTVKPANVEYLHPYLRAEIEIEGKTLGYFGKLHPTIAEKLELKETPFDGEIDLNLMKELSQKPVYRPISKFPPAKRDFAFVFNEEQGKAEEILNTAKEIFGNLLEEAFIFDVYKGEKIGEGKLSVAVRVILRHSERSLSDDEVNALAEEFIKAMEQKGFKVRT
jgi:phenylalanyl-tRNA synthetase beta chain